MVKFGENIERIANKGEKIHSIKWNEKKIFQVKDTSQTRSSTRKFTV